MGNLLKVPVITKSTNIDTKAFLGTYANSAMQGFRRTMEDTHITEVITHENHNFLLLAVFDGHGDDKCAIFCRDNFSRILKNELMKVSDESIDMYKRCLTSAFIQIDIEFREYFEKYNKLLLERGNVVETGTTALITIVTNTHYIVANAGDSRCVIIDKTIDRVLFATVDHKPNMKSERDRITKAGHFVSNNRVNSDLALSRAIGDFNYKDKTKFPEECAVTCIPDVTAIERNDNTMVILACDGIWDVIKSEEISQHLTGNKYVYKRLIEFSDGSSGTINHNPSYDLQNSVYSFDDSQVVSNLCEKIINIAFDKESNDNISVVMFLS
jgi:serine/threonine protein phosphatase PrpC